MLFGRQVCARTKERFRSIGSAMADAKAGPSDRMQWLKVHCPCVRQRPLQDPAGRGL